MLVSETMLFITKLSKLAAALFKRCSKEPRLRSTATIVEVQEVWQPSVYDEDDEEMRLLSLLLSSGVMGM